MKTFGKLSLAVAAAAILGAATVAEASTYSYVGSWEVDQGANWTSQPAAYSGQQAAALLFGGTASDYVISTVSALASDINFSAWYSILGVPDGTVFAQNYYSATSGGLYYDGQGYAFGDTTNPASALVNDNALGSQYTNYAFRISPVPLPLGAPLLASGLGLFVIARRKRAKTV